MFRKLNKEVTPQIIAEAMESEIGIGEEQACERCRKRSRKATSRYCAPCSGSRAEPIQDGYAGY